MLVFLPKETVIRGHFTIRECLPDDNRYCSLRVGFIPEVVMRQKIAILIFVLMTCAVFLPSQATAAGKASANMTKPQIRIHIGHRHDRGRHRGWHRGRRIYYYYYDRHDPHYARQTYWVNGRRYTRWVRYY